MVDKFIVVPLIFIFVVSFVNIYFTGDVGGFGEIHEYNGLAPAGSVLYDDTGHQVCYENGSVVSGGEVGTLSVYGDNVDSGRPVYRWRNSSLGVGYILDYDQYGDADTKLSWIVTGSLGMLGIIAGIMVLATVVGVRVLGIGISEMSISTLVKGTAYMSIFLLGLSMSYSRIVEIPVFGWALFFGLTGCYTLGMINQMGHVGGGD